MRLRCFAVLSLALGLVACGQARAPEAQPPTRAAKPAPSRGRHAELFGRWSPTLPPREARAVVLARAALATPPDDAALAAIHPSPEEQQSYAALVELRETDPESPRLATVRRKLTEFDAMLVEIDAQSIGWRAPGTDERHPYRVLADEGDVVTIATADETLDVRFLDPDHISMRGRTRTFLLTRDRAIPRDASSPPPAWNGRVVRPGREGPSSRAARDLTVLPGPGRPASSGAPRDACEAYADCIDQMPRLAGDQPLMSSSSSTIRGWEKTPERLRQCAAAHEMARAGALCR